MTERELKKLSRVELLEMLLALSKENEALNRELDTLRAQQEDKRITMEKAGSIAEAALALSGVFQAAQAAADLYLNSVRGLAPEEVLDHPQEDEASRQLLDDTQRRCDDMLASAQQEVDAMWQRFYQMSSSEQEGGRQ